MKNKLYDELYPKLHQLISTDSNFNDFYNPWWNEKCLDYTGDKLSDYYNIFFSRFVAFNALYNTIIYTKESMGLLKIKKSKKNNKIIERSDKEKAITMMAKELSDSTLLTLFEKPEVVESIYKIIEIIKSERFVITHKIGKPAPQEDFKIVAKLENQDVRERYTAVLELSYNLRCNLFHGGKSYQSDQLILLQPINNLVFHVVTHLYDTFKSMMCELIETIEKEIEQSKKTLS